MLASKWRTEQTMLQQQFDNLLLLLLLSVLSFGFNNQQNPKLYHNSSCTLRGRDRKVTGGGRWRGVYTYAVCQVCQ